MTENSEKWEWRDGQEPAEWIKRNSLGQSVTAVLFPPPQMIDKDAGTNTEDE